MKKFKDYINEATPTNSTGASIANYDPLLFPYDDELLSQDYQTPAETGEDKYTRFAAIYPVMKVSLKSNLGDGPSIDAMVQASNEFVNLMYKETALNDINKHNLKQFLNNQKSSAQSQ